MVDVVPYNPQWPQIFEKIAAEIKDALKDNCMAVHHVGSTAIPGLMAKDKIDIVAVIRNPVTVIQDLERTGYTYRGEWNIPFQYGFTKRGDVRVNLHVYEEGHPEITTNILFRDYLRTHSEVRDEYARIKQELLEDPNMHVKNNAMFVGYTLGKSTFIEDVLRKAGFQGTRFLRCTHPHEWAAYHRIRKELLFDPVNIIYDPQHPTITDPNHAHLILSQGGRIVSVAQVEFLSDPREACLRSLATDTPYQQKGVGAQMLALVEKWIRKQGRSIVKTHARLSAEPFYRKRGYVDMEFDDISMAQEVIDLGKRL